MRRRARERGSGLIDALIGSLILGVVTSAAAALLTTHVVVGRRNENRTHAVAMARQELETLRSFDYADVVSRTSTASWTGKTYTTATTVRNDQPAANMKEVTVLVSWREGNATPSYVARTVYTAVRR